MAKQKSAPHKHIDELEAIKERLRILFNKWYARLLLHNWHFDVNYEYENDTNDARVRGRASVQWEYLRGTIYFYLPQLTSCTDAELEELVIHELMHVMVNEMREWDSLKPETMHHEERVATILQRAFQNIK